LAFVFILGWIIAWVVQDMWAMSILGPSATERRKIVWDREYAKHQNQREEEEEARKKAGLRWQDPRPDEHCLRYGTRRYTSKLENVPEGYSKLKACHETQAWINGRWSTPSQCDDQGLWGGIVGTWVVDYEEASCHTFWEFFKDKALQGCTAQGSGMRRIESPLKNLYGEDDGMRMCASTPAEFHGLRFDGPHSCAYWVGFALIYP
ncbi:hypothetical protein FA13DRAFT_1639271, partial [Coprinellus micaceus]